MEQRFDENRDAFLQSEIVEFPYFKRRIDKRLALPWIYGDMLNWMRGLGYMLYRYIGPERLRLVELIRHPVATCRSMLAHYRDSSFAPFRSHGSCIERRVTRDLARMRTFGWAIWL